VRFESLHPPGTDLTRRNNQSCVLRMAAPGGSMPRTGDVERAAEMRMIAKRPTADVLLVPHHGSCTSSSPEFIAAVAPRWAVVTAGYRSRFGHPSAEVLARYRAAGAHIMRTDSEGAVHILLEKEGPRVFGERDSAARYWRRASGV
jgi:competence protein ComEC